MWTRVGYGAIRGDYLDEITEYRYSIRKTLMPFLLLHLGLVLQTSKPGTTVQEGSVEDPDLEVEVMIVRSIFSKKF